MNEIPKIDGPRRRKRKSRFFVDKAGVKTLHLVAVAYSHVRREWFPTEDAYIAEVEVKQRAKEVVEALEKLGIKA